MPDAIRCCRCGCDITDDDGGGWPDKDGLLCQMCWERECSRLWWQAVAEIERIREILNSPEGIKATDQILASDAQP